MQILLQIRYKSAARPSDYSNSADERLLAVGFLDLVIFSKETQKELLNYKFSDENFQNDVRLLYGFAGKDEWGTWSLGYKSGIVINLPGHDEDVLVEMRYILLDAFSSGVEASLSINSDEYISVLLDGTILKIDVFADKSPAGYNFFPPAEIIAPNKRAILILGMHRSGTSALTRMFALTGAALPNDLMMPMPDNPLGFWESNTISLINDSILRSIGSAWDSINLTSIPDYIYKMNESGLVDVLSEEYNGKNFIVLKDPRISLMIKLWSNVLQRAGYSTDCVIIFRNPLDVAESLYNRNKMPRKYGVLLWTRYMISILESITNGKFVTFDEITENPMDTMRAISDDLAMSNLDLSDKSTNEIEKFIDKQLNHNKNIGNIYNIHIDDALNLYDAIKKHRGKTTSYTREIEKAKKWLHENATFLQESEIYGISKNSKNF
jgi:hypothetical protein